MKERSLVASTVDSSLLKEIFERENCPGLKAMVEFLESEKGRQTRMLGITLDPHHVTSEPFSAKLAQLLVHIEIGNSKQTPLEWLAVLAEWVPNATENERKGLRKLDSACGEVARISQMDLVPLTTAEMHELFDGIITDEERTALGLGKEPGSGTVH